MKITFAKLALGVYLGAAATAVGSAGVVCAQTAPNATAKRNSPFAPNPKKKVKNNLNKSSEKGVKIQNAVTSVAESEIQPATQSRIKPSAGAANQNAEFESRSAAGKTLEIAKRAVKAEESAIPKKPTEIYKVGAGDVLDIRILNAPTATAKNDSTLFTVLENGLIDYPLAGDAPVAVGGLTTGEIEVFLKEKIKLYENPEIAVAVREYASKTVSVLGLVERPGAKALRREAIPLYAVLAEAIPRETAKKVTILRGADKQTLVVGLDDPETLVYANDIIRVVSSGGEEKLSKIQPQFFYIGGQINSGGRKDFHDGLTLTQAILASGGLKKNSARKVVIRRRDAEGKLAPAEYDLKLIKAGKTADPILQAGDTIEIEN